MLSSSTVTDLVRLAEQLRILANIDGMTGAANRRHFVERAEAKWIRFTRYGQPLSLLALDLDLFKSINDQFGHDVGDEVIRAATCAASVRGSDILGHMGGEEFAILMPQTAMGPAREVAERIRRQVEQLGFRSNGRAIRVSASLGLAHADAGRAEVGMLFKRADEALYAAKRSGRNCVMAVADVGIQPHADAGASIAVGAA